MANDERNRELVSAYLDDELSPDERSYVERLLERDDDLRDYHHELLGVRDAIRGLPHFELPATFAASVLDRIESQRKTRGPVVNRRRIPRYVGWAIVTAAALVLAVVAWWPEPRASHESSVAGTGDLDREGRDANRLSSGDGPQGASGNATDPAGVDGERGSSPDGNRVDSRSNADGTNRRADPVRPGSLAGSSRPGDRASGPPRGVAGGDPVGDNSGTPTGTPTVTPMATAVPFVALVLDIVLTKKGIDGKVFEAALQRADIPMRNSIAVDATFERSIMAQRVFGALDARDLPLPPAPEGLAEPDYFQMVFVVARGRQFDTLISDFYAQRVSGDVAAVDFDVTMGSSDSSLFVRMEELAQKTPSVPTSAVHAHPVVMAEELRTRLHSMLHSAQAKRGVPELTMPELADPDGGKGAPILPPGGEDAIREMEEMQFDMLFVLRSESVARRSTPSK